MAFEKWQARCKAADSSSRGEILSEAAEDHLAGEDITLDELATLIGEWWRSCDNHPSYLMWALTDQLYYAGDKFTLPAVKAAGALAFYESLADKLVVYRGCYEGKDEQGLYWSTDKKIAENMPFLPENIRHGKRILIEGEINKSDLYMVFNKNNEATVMPDLDCFFETNRSELTARPSS